MYKLKKEDVKNLFLDLGVIILGGFIWALSINTFTLPNLIAPGGIAGLATVFNHFFGFPMGLTILIINLPLFFISLRMYGKHFLIRTGAALIITSVILDITTFLPHYTEDKLLAAIFGGITAGVGLGIIYMRGMATGGVDLIARILEKPFPYISYGRMIIIIDAVIIIIAAISFRDLSAVLYASIVVYITGIINDSLLNGLNKAKLVYIISDKYNEISDEIHNIIKRGATFIDAKGSYTGKDKNMLMVVVRPYEFYRLKAMVYKIDNNAFIIVGDVNEVVGKGFKSDIQ